MWIGAATRRISLRFVSSRAPIPNPNFNIKPSLGSSAENGCGPAVLPASHLHNAADPWKLGLRGPTVEGGSTSAAATFSSAASAREALAEAAVLGSLGSSASSSISHKARDVSEAIRHYGRCYWELSKARLSMLVVATSGAGYVLGSGSSIDFTGLCCTCAGTMMVAASANTLNQVFEIENDAKMKRTKQRPLPSGRLSVPHAATWAASVATAGTSLLAWKANYLAAGLAASNLVLYAFVYTPLKQMHPANTWVGAIVGAIPPLLGWAAACGEVSLNAMILPAALYFWQIPHFMALAYLCRSDYIAGGFRMFSLADASGQRTALVSFRNCIYMLPLGILAYDWGLTSEWFTLESSLLTISLGIAALLFVCDRTAKNARRMFHASLLYLPVFMSGLLFHRLPNEQNERMISEASESDGILLSEDQVHDDERNSTSNFQHLQTKRPPVSYASVAPFPFLPAPIYLSPDL